MQITIPFNVGDKVEDIVDHSISEIIGISYKHGVLDHEKTNERKTFWYSCVSINTTDGFKEPRNLKLIPFDGAFLIDSHGV